MCNKMGRHTLVGLKWKYFCCSVNIYASNKIYATMRTYTRQSSRKKKCKTISADQVNSNYDGEKYESYAVVAS